MYNSHAALLTDAAYDDLDLLDAEDQVAGYVGAMRIITAAEPIGYW